MVSMKFENVGMTTYYIYKKDDNKSKTDTY